MKLRMTNDGDEMRLRRNETGQGECQKYANILTCWNHNHRRKKARIDDENTETRDGK